MAPIIEKNTRVRVRKEENRSSFAWQIARGILRLILLVLFGVSVWYVTRLSFFTLSEVTVSGGVTIPHDDILAQVENELQGTYFHVIPKRFSYLYPHDRIVEILEKNKKLHNISAVRTARSSIAVHFDEYVPHSLLCPQNESVPCYFMTRAGYAFAEAPSLQGSALTRHIKEGQNEIKEGTVISEEVLLRSEVLIQRLKDELGLRVASLIHKENGDIVFNINGGGMIYVNTKKDFNVSFENLKAVLGTSEFSHIRPGNFQYIDVRFDNKAFVNEEMATSTEEVSEETLPLPE